MNARLSESIGTLFERYSIPVTLDEVVGVTARPVPDRRVSGPLVAAAVFVLVVSVGALGFLLPRERASDSAVEPSAPTLAPAPTSTPSSSATTSQAPGPTTAPIVYADEPYVILNDPLVIQEIPHGPEPSFDASGLGVESQLAPFDSLTEDDLALIHSEFPLVTDTPIVALGHLPDLAAFRKTVDAFDAPHICDWGVGINDLAQQNGEEAPLGECAFNQTPRPDLTVVGPRYPAQAGLDAAPAYQVFWSGLSDGVSVVAINVSGEGTPPQWQRLRRSWSGSRGRRGCAGASTIGGHTADEGRFRSCGARRSQDMHVILGGVGGSVDDPGSWLSGGLLWGGLPVWFGCLTWTAGRWFGWVMDGTLETYHDT